MNIIDEKEKFLINEIINLSINAAFATRNKNYPIYANSKYHDEALKTHIKGYLLDYYQQLIQMRELTNSDVKKEIKKLTDTTTKNFANLLFKKQFRIGIAQKIINLFLKYLWVSKLIQFEPPLCPIDNIVRSRLNCKSLKKWTEIDCYSELEEYYTLIRGEKGNNSIAEWELKEWNRM